MNATRNGKPDNAPKRINFWKLQPLVASPSHEILNCYNLPNSRQTKGVLNNEDAEPEIADEICWLRIDCEMTTDSNGNVRLERKRRQTHGDMRSSHLH